MTLRQRQPVHRDRAYLDLAYVPGTRCLRCGGWPCEPCHYSGYLSHIVGKGGASKAADLVSAHLCRACHVALDTYTNGNSAERAADFLMLCWQTLLRNLDAGHVSLTVNTLVRESADATPAKIEGQNTAGRIKKLRSFSAKTGHRNGASTRKPEKSKIAWRPA